MRLIDADELIEAIDEQITEESSGVTVLLVGFAKEILNTTPAVKVEQINKYLMKMHGGA